MVNLVSNIKKFTFIISYLIVLTGCVFFAPSPHENFIEHLNSAIGKNIDDIDPLSLPHKIDLIESKRLSNGNIENKYKYSGTCNYYYEIEPKTRKIVAARFEGKQDDCTMNP